MDILIKGMDLTEGACAINLTICSNGKVYGSQQVGDSMVRINTTAVALPEHHGRLGDLDALQKQIEDDIETVAKEKGKVGLRELWQILNKNIENAPVIVEATE